MITVHYQLSDVGQKAELTAGRDGKRNRFLELVQPADPIVLKYASLDSEGNGTLDISDNNRRLSPFKVVEESSICWVDGYYPGRNHYLSASNEASVRYTYKLLSQNFSRSFDHILTPEDVAQIIKTHDEQMELALVNLHPNQAEAYAEAAAEAALRKPILDAAAEANRLLVEENESKKEAEGKTQEQERAKWVAQYGSSRLQKSLAAGYECQGAYVMERLALEFGEGWDMHAEAEWKHRVYPSEAALDLAANFETKGYEAEAVWLTSNGLDGFEACEAVVVKKFLSKYSVFHIV
ncbi:MAG: hypothetical protein Q8O55_08885 [Dehalococcoidales bacterium]|nr:hypothetical protein [Dehalococcoidales bacterium]